MAIQLISTLKNWFGTGKKPTGQHFSDFIDSFLHRTEGANLPISRVEGLDTALQAVGDAANKLDKDLTNVSFNCTKSDNVYTVVNHPATDVLQLFLVTISEADLPNAASTIECGNNTYPFVREDGTDFQSDSFSSTFPVVFLCYRSGGQIRLIGAKRSGGTATSNFYTANGQVLDLERVVSFINDGNVVFQGANGMTTVGDSGFESVSIDENGEEVALENRNGVFEHRSSLGLPIKSAGVYPATQDSEYIQKKQLDKFNPTTITSLPAPIPLDVNLDIHISNLSNVNIDFDQSQNTSGRIYGIITVVNPTLITTEPNLNVKGDPLTPGQVNSIKYSAYNGFLTDVFNNVQGLVIAPPSDTTPPTLSNFRVDNDFPNRIKFDSSEEIKGLTFSGFSVVGVTINSMVIDSGNTTGHYFVCSANLLAGNSYKISYNGTNDLKDVFNNNLAAFSNVTIVNNLAVTFTLLDRWRFNQSLNNELATGQNLTLQGGTAPVYINSKPSVLTQTHSLDFKNIPDGTSTNYLSTGRVHPDKFSFSSWVYVSLNDHISPVASNLLGCETGYFRLRLRRASSMIFEIRYANGATQTITSTGTINDNAWNHVAFTYDKNLQVLKFYLNGVLTDTFSSVTSTAAQSQIILSYDNNGSPSSINNTRMCDVRIYEGVIPLSLIQDIYNGNNQ